MLLLYIPDRSKQHARRIPAASLSQATSIRFARVSPRLPEVIKWIQSRRDGRHVSSQTRIEEAGSDG